MLKKHNLNPKLISPSGKNGHIVKEDVLNYLEKSKQPTLPMHAQFQMEHRGITVKLFPNMRMKSRR
jgi:hypothetical protein